MKMTMRALRSLLSEVIAERFTLEKETESEWLIRAGFINKAFTDYPGMSLSSKGTYSKTLRNSDLTVVAPFLVKKSFEPYLTREGIVPEGVRPIEVIKAIKTGEHVTQGGVTLRSEPGVQESLAAAAVERLVPPSEKIDYVASLGSSSTLAATFGRALAERWGARFVESAFLLRGAKLDIPQDARFDEKQLARLNRSFDRAKAKGAGTFKSKHFPKQFAHLVSYEVDHSDEMLNILTEPNTERETVVLVDDLVSTGTALASVARSLEGDRFDIVGIVALFKTQE